MKNYEKIMTEKNEKAKSSQMFGLQVSKTDKSSMTISRFLLVFFLVWFLGILFIEVML